MCTFPSSPPREARLRGAEFFVYCTGMKKWVVLEKKIGETPLAALRAWRALHPEYADIPASYAGRLDPMASGKLFILLGDECKRQTYYTGLDKEYEIEVLLDLHTDTGDVLGLPSSARVETQPRAEEVKRVLYGLRGTSTVAYPVFSSKTVGGKPLFLHVLEGTLETIEVPTHEETMYRMELLELTKVSKEVLHLRIQELLGHAPRSDEPSKRLGADFRQDAIRSAWRELFDAVPDRTFTVLRLRVSCGSGAYMRTLAGRIGAALGTTALAFSIRRTKIGRAVPLIRSRVLWITQYR
jgi:tRNA U55 pseudouridine synthase TruB